jgi:NAD(P)-dependent dehydrogenase (short-subunit alcohol dehydrogenase family)
MGRDIAGRVVAVTGVTAGIGRATAERLVAAGATVVGCARDTDRLAAARDELPRLHTIPCDVRDAEQRAAFVDAVVAQHGRIDAFVNNAGVGRVGWLAEMTADDVADVFTTNAIAYTDFCRLVLPHLLAAGHGDIVLVSSSAAWIATPPLTLYAASKHALTGLVQGLRAEVRDKGVLVHSINPGPVTTEFASRAGGYHPDEGEPGVAEPIKGSVPPERIAEAVERCLRAPSAQTLAVPPYVALGQLSHVPVVGSLIEAAVGHLAPALIDKGRQIVTDRIPRRAG